jgi:putative hydrolase
VRARLNELLLGYAESFETDPNALEHKLGDLDPTSLDPSKGMEELFGDPEVLLGAIRSPRQLELLPHLDALVMSITGYVDHLMDRVGEGLVGSYGMVTEAMRRRRVEASSSDRFVERLFGLELTQDRYERGEAFVEGIVERAGEDGLARLWSSADVLPTPAEIDAPGLWLARIDL